MLVFYRTHKLKKQTKKQKTNITSNNTGQYKYKLYLLYTNPTKYNLPATITIHFPIMIKIKTQTMDYTIYY